MNLENILSMLTIHFVNNCPNFGVSPVNYLQSVSTNPATHLCFTICKIPGDRFTNDLSAKKFVSSFLRTVCVSQTPSTYEILKDFAKIFLNIVVTLRQGGGDLIFQKIS